MRRWRGFQSIFSVTVVEGGIFILRISYFKSFTDKKFWATKAMQWLLSWNCLVRPLHSQDIVDLRKFTADEFSHIHEVLNGICKFLVAITPGHESSAASFAKHIGEQSMDEHNGA